MKNHFKTRVREIQDTDISLLADYWYLSEDDFLTGMGVDLKKLPTRENFTAMLDQQIKTPVEKKGAYALIWEVDGKPVGHSNINKIIFGKEAYMHLHLWKSQMRKKGLGTQLVKASIPIYFDEFNLEELICEPMSGNPAPNKTLENAGFVHEKTYITIPGIINYEQEVNRWKMTRSRFKEIYEKR